MHLELGPKAVVAYRGYRCIGRRTAILWDVARRERYLFAREVSIPVSLDSWVTPEAKTTDGPGEKVEIMAIATVEDDGDILNQWRFPEVTPTPSSPIGDDWLFLGFDVCDLSNISAIMNCAPSDSSRAIPGYWKLAVNRHHLFDRFIDADVFRKDSDRRISEHAPFVVMALFAHVPDIEVR
jgi:hypothetical protein